MSKNPLTKAGSLILTAAICAGMLSVAGVPALKTKAESREKLFTADFSSIQDGVIDTADSDAVNTINSKFYVYNAQRLAQNSFTSYFERGKVNGYLVDDQAQAKPRYPDTAAFPAWNLDGWDKHADKTNADKPIPMWRVDGKWLTCDAYSGSDAFLTREANLLYVKGNTPSGFASFENFTAQMGLKFKPLSDSVVDGSDAFVLVYHAMSAGQLTDPNQITLALDASGNVYVGSLDWSETPICNEALKDASGNQVSLERDKEYKLSVTVLGEAVKIGVYDGSSLVGSCEKSGVRSRQGVSRGLLGFGGSNAGVYIADVQIARQDENGKTVDINDNGSGYGFGFDPQTTATFRYMYYVDTGSGTPEQVWKNYYFRTDTDMHWMNFWNNRGGETTWFGNGFTKETAAMNSLMGLYYEQYGTAGRAFRKVSFDDRNHAEIELGEDTSGQFVNMDNGNRILAIQDNNNGPGYMLKEMTSYTPLTADGKDAQAENAEMFFNTLLVSDNPQRTSAITFRSKEAGRMMADDANGGYADKLTVVLSGNGFRVYDGEAMPINGDEVTYTSWNGGAVNGVFVDVWAKLAGDKLYLKVYDANTVYYDNTQSPMTVKTTGEGYMYYTVLGGWGYIADFKAAQLDEDGNRLPWNFQIGGVALSDLADQGLLKTIGHAGFVGDDFQMDWTNAGFEITGTLSGDVSIVAKRTDHPGMVNDIDGSYVDVIVDGGEPTRVKIPAGTDTIKLVSGLAEGKHTVQVTSATSAAFGSLSVSHVEFTGTLDAPKPENSKLHILAIGDSITAGFGVYGKNGEASNFADQVEKNDGYYSYAAVVGRELDAKLCVVAKESGRTSEMHDYVNKLNIRSGAPDWDWSKDTHDVVVINLGTNDEGNGTAKETVLADAKSLLDDMRAKNPNAEIIWVYGMMRKDYEDVYQTAVKYMNDKGDSKVHLLEMEKNEEGLAGHPNKAAHAEYGKQLADYIRSLVNEPYAAHTDTLKALDDAGKLVVSGRNKWNSTALASTLGAAGFMVKGDIADEVVLNVKQSDNMVRLGVIVDGNTAAMKTVEIQPGESTVTLAEGLTRGTHTIEVRRVTSDLGMTELQSIKYHGTLMQPEKKALQLEFIGDSITVGEGMLWTNGGGNYVLEQNTMLGYASKTAAKLSADFSMVAHSGHKTADMVSSYAKANDEFALNSDGKKVVVINLGTNDVGFPQFNLTESELAAMRKSVGDLMDAVVEQNGKHVCIVWAYGMMFDKDLHLLQEMVESQANGRNIWFCDLSAAKDNAGWGEHPSQVGNDKAADILAQFITDNCLPVVEAGHTLESVAAKAADCQNEGNIEHYRCTVCGKLFADATGTKELFAADVVTSKTQHALIKTEAKAATCTAEGNIEYYTCSVCSKLFGDAAGTQGITLADTVIDKLAHTYGDYQHDENGHWKECSCGDKTAAGAHTGGTATCTEQAVCSVCGAKYGSVDKTKHGETEVRDAKAAICTEDGYTGDTYCKVCGDKLETGTVIKAGHTITKVEAKAATCTAEGNIEHYTCSVCGKLFADAAGTREIAAADTVLAKLAHDLAKVEAKAATTESEGNIEYWRCADCGKLFADADGKQELFAADVVIAKLPAEEKPSSTPDNTEDKPPVTGERFYPIALATVAALTAVTAMIAILTKKKKVK